LEYIRTSILRINSNTGDAKIAKEWASDSIYYLNESRDIIKKIHELTDGFNLETFTQFKAAKAQFKAIKSITIGLPEFFELNRDQSVNSSVNEVVEHVNKVDGEISKLITEIDTWFE
jgi:hypothetical protein